MKKFVVFMLSCVMVFVSLLNITLVGASGDTIDKDTVESLIKGGYQLYNKLRVFGIDTDTTASGMLVPLNTGVYIECFPGKCCFAENRMLHSRALFAAIFISNVSVDSLVYNEKIQKYTQIR